MYLIQVHDRAEGTISYGESSGIVASDCWLWSGCFGVRVLCAHCVWRSRYQDDLDGLGREVDPDCCSQMVMDDCENFVSSERCSLERMHCW